MENIKDLQYQLISMLKKDDELRNHLLNQGILSETYHPEMEKIHNHNAEELQKIIDFHGWPSSKIVGKEAAHAAWIIAQHAIAKPKFQKFCLVLLKQQLKNGEVDASYVAFLEDRIKIFEGKKQIYGTQIDWNNQGELAPYPLEQPDNIDELRRKMGLPPFKESIEKARLQARKEGNKPPTNLKEKNEEFLAWTKKVGWRE